MNVNHTHKNRKRHVTYEILVWMAMAAMLLYVLRLWPILLLVILAMLIVSIRLLVLSTENVESISAELPQTVPEPAKENTEKDVIELAYSVILKRITEIICMEYPGARWVWEASNAKHRIENGENVFILLNRAGGYRRARVVIQNLQVVTIDFLSTEAEYTSQITVEEMDSVEQSVENEEQIESETPVENYELMAFEWVESYTLELNDRCNEAIGAGMKEIMLVPEELPVKESWPNVCKELERIGLKDVEGMPEGIKIRLCCDQQKGNEV